VTSHVHGHPFDTLCTESCPAYNWPDAATRQKLSSPTEHEHTSGKCYANHNDPMPAYQLQAWEVIPRNEAFDAQDVYQQRDELLAAVGLLVEFLSTPTVAVKLNTHSLMKSSVSLMGHRYGPWSR
jgi:hypothetical protein